MTEKQILVRLSMAIKDVLENEENENYIPFEEVDGTLLFYCLGTLMPNVIYNQVAEEKVNHIGFNQVQQHLILKYSLKDQREKLNNSNN